ncbi:hypothetical protein [Spirosoma koreense]
MATNPLYKGQQAVEVKLPSEESIGEHPSEADQLIDINEQPSSAGESNEGRATE